MKIMSVIKATVTITMFIIIVLASNAAYGQNDRGFNYNNNRLWKRSNNRNSGNFVFPKDHIPPEDNPPEYGSGASSQENSMIPLEFFKKLTNVTDTAEFIHKFVDQDSIDPQDGIANRFGTDDIERSSAKEAKQAICMPAQTIVSLEPHKPSNDPSVIYFPQCTRVNRCGGCCTTPILSCQPIANETLTLSISKYRYVSQDKLIYLNKELISVEQHTKCMCDCRLKKEHCNAYQNYVKPQCKCICKNYDEQTKCIMQGKIWDDQQCKCHCQNELECTTGTVFDENICNCTELHESRLNFNNAALDRKSFIIKALPFEPDNNTRYDTDE